MPRTIFESNTQPPEGTCPKELDLKVSKDYSPVAPNSTRDSESSQPTSAPPTCTLTSSQATHTELKQTIPVPERTYVDVLTRFDYDSRYGPCSGLTRLERWERAKRLGLRPEVEVRTYIARAERDALRMFDFDVRFGPCLGISRVERWERALKLGLEPPAEIEAILQLEMDSGESDGCRRLGIRTRLW